MSAITFRETKMSLISDMIKNVIQLKYVRPVNGTIKEIDIGDLKRRFKELKQGKMSMFHHLIYFKDEILIYMNLFVSIVVTST